MKGRVGTTILMAWLLGAGVEPATECYATNYRTDLLKAMAMKMDLPERIDTMASPSYNSRPLSVAADATGRVTHIGYRFFSTEQREALGTIACNFVERYMLELNLAINPPHDAAERMRLDGVTLTGSSSALLPALCADTAVAIHLQVMDGQGYTMSWHRNDSTLCSISFPVEYNLLVGTDMDERERRLEEDMLLADSISTPTYCIEANRLRKAWNDNYYTLQRGHYLLESLTANQYFEKDSVDKLRPIFRRQLPVESLANLLTGAIGSDSYQISLKVRKYGFKTDTLKVSLQQFLNFCHHEGCQPYFGLISLNDEEAECELIMHNAAMGYNHVLKVTAPINIIKEGRGTLEARFTPYVTSSRIRNLFEEFIK